MATTNCLGLYKPGGADGVVYVGSRPDVATLTIGVTGITALTLKAGKVLYKYASKSYVHDAKGSLVVQENLNMFKHSITCKFFPFAQADWNALESLLKARRMFIIYISKAGKVIALGLDTNPYLSDIDDERGLTPTSGDWAEGILQTDVGSLNVTLEGDFYNVRQEYKPAQSLATNITELDALLVAA